MKIVIDQGHGSKDTGAAAYYGYSKNHIYESDLNFVLGGVLGTILSFDNHVSYTRHVDEYLTLEERVRLINKKDPDICLSMHCNAAESKNASGFEVWHYPSEFSLLLADKIHGFVSFSLGQTMKMRGAKPSKNFYILRETKCPCVLIEAGFLSNKTDLHRLLCPTFQQELMLAIARGVTQYNYYTLDSKRS